MYAIFSEFDTLVNYNSVKESANKGSGHWISVPRWILHDVTYCDRHLRRTKMREHYDFSKMKGRKNPFIKYLKQPITMRLDRDTVSYFKGMAEESGIPYQTLINLYLRDCAAHQRKLKMKWTAQ
jgi:uncharacterized protein (DUF4415 family)